MARRRHTAVSLFTGAAIGDVGFRAAGYAFLAACELEPERAALARLNFPESTTFAEDVWTVGKRLIASVKNQLAGADLDLLVCTAPCQGMSKNGQGTLLRNARLGKRPRLDPRNRLILPALAIACKLQPRWLVLENVLAMRNTLIEDERGRLRPILDVVFATMGPGYAGQAYDVEFADYGIPQRRQRLITVLTRQQVARKHWQRGGELIPPATHGRQPRPGQRPWFSVAEAIADFPPLDSHDPSTAVDPDLSLHRVPVLDPKKYDWVRHTPPGRSAFDNQCVQRGCGFQGNTTHGAAHDDEGINRPRDDTPLYCRQCGALLPRPYVIGPDGQPRIMRGYTSAYKRMDPTLPASALTRNLSYPCSDQKLHPFQNRVLSLAEALRLHTVDRYAYQWGPMEATSAKGKRRKSEASDSLMRLVVGESVPPYFFELLGRRLRSLEVQQPEA